MRTIPTQSAKSTMITLIPPVNLGRDSDTFTPTILLHHLNCLKSLKRILVGKEHDSLLEKVCARITSSNGFLISCMLFHFRILLV